MESVRPISRSEGQEEVENCSVRFTLTRVEYLRAIRNRYIRRRDTKLGFAICIFLLGLGLALMITYGPLELAGVIVICGAIGALSVTAGHYFFGSIRTWNRNLTAKEERIYTFSEGGLDVATASITATSPWTAFERLVEIKEAYLLIANTGAFIVIPLRGFASEEEQARFRTLVANGHLPASFRSKHT